MAGKKRTRSEPSQSSSRKKRRKTMQNVLPSSYQILKEKKKCRPDKLEVFVSESAVRASLQTMLDLTMTRLLLDPKIATKIYDLQKKFGSFKLEFIYKLGNLKIQIKLPFFFK